MNHRYGVMIVKYTLIRCANKTTYYTEEINYRH